MYDHYEEATPEIIAKREEEECLQAEIEAIDEWMLVEVYDEFRKAFSLAKKCTAEQHYRRVFQGVYISPDGCLVASDTHQIVEIPCEYIPNELLGKCVIKLGENQAGVHTKQKFPEFRHYFTLDKYVMAAINEIQFSLLPESKETQYFKHFDTEVEILKHKDSEIAFQKKYLDLMREILVENITVYYNPDKILAPVVFEGDNARMIIMPLRRYTD